jgi:hypothetical protein
MRLKKFKLFLENNIDDVLDKISSNGFDSLSSEEKKWLDNQSSPIIYKSNDNKFEFELEKKVDYGDSIVYKGLLKTPNIRTEYLDIKGDFSGEIIVDSQGKVEQNFITIDGSEFLEDYLHIPGNFKDELYNFLNEIIKKI